MKKPWTEKDEAELRILDLQGKTMAEMASLTRRSKTAIRIKLNFFHRNPDHQPILRAYQQNQNYVETSKMTNTPVDEVIQIISDAMAEISELKKIISKGTERVCILKKCSTKFISDGAHHRMCNYCRKHAVDYLPNYSILTG